MDNQGAVAKLGNLFHNVWLGCFRYPYHILFIYAMEVTDLTMLDFKEIVSSKHKELTGWGNENIVQMAKYLSDLGKDMWIRHVLVPGLGAFPPP